MEVQVARAANPEVDTMPEILVVDDTPSHLRLMEFLLASEYHVVTPIDNPREALEYLKTHTPSLIILDIQMPDLSGLDFARRVKNVSRLADVPIIMVTAQRGGELAQEVARVGAEMFVEKPLDGRDFRALVNGFMERPLPLSAVDGDDASRGFVQKY